MMFSCRMCYFTSQHMQSLTTHTVKHHRYDPTFEVQCNFEGCGVSYNSWSSFKSHVYRKHRQDIFANNNHVVDDNEDCQQEHLEDMQGAVELSQEEIIKWNSVKFHLKLKESANLAQKTTTKVIGHIENLITDTLNCVQERLLNSAATNANGTLNAEEINEVFNGFSTGNVSIAKTKYELDKFLITHGKLIVPEKIVLDLIWTWVHKPRKHLVQKPILFYYVPFFATLEQLLNQNDILYCVNNPLPFQENGLLKNFTDGSFYHSHSIFKDKPKALIINLYYDDVEIVNPLGSKTKKHKVGMFYWSLGNIHPKYRSSLKAINLLAVIKTSFVRKYGVKVVLSQFVDDIKMLEAGKIFKINGSDVLFHGSLFIFSGDTLAANYVGGFKEGVSFAYRPCRSCLGTKESIKESFVETDFTLRNHASHLHHCQDVEEPTLTQEAKRFWSRQYGVNEKSVLCDLEHFDITRCLVHDLMHVVIEGPIEMECRLFLKYCVHEKCYFNLSYLNSKIKYFIYKHLAKDTPSNVENAHLDSKLRQSCAQMIALANLLPFLIHERVPGNDEKLLNLICHLQILNQMMAFQNSNDDIELLKYMIEVHHTTFKELYPDAPITPKMHFMLHMPRQIQEFGPLRHQWCMRYEGTHSRLRPLVTSMKNFKNVPYSLSYRFQSLRCAELFQVPNDNKSKYLYAGDDIRPGPSIQLSNHNSCNMIKHALNIETENILVLCSKQVTLHGTTYKRDSVILTSDDEDSLPTFGLITEIFVYATKICFLYRELDTLHFEQCLNAYKVIQTDSYYVIKADELIHPFPLSVFSTNANQCLSSYVILLNHRRCEFY